MFDFLKKKPIKQDSGHSGSRKRSDRRRALRRRQRESDGYIWCDGLLAPRPCSLEDLSSTGARVALTGSEIPPHLLDKVMRFFVRSEKHEIDCRVAWTNGLTIGLAFLGRPHPPTRTYR